MIAVICPRERMVGRRARYIFEPMLIAMAERLSIVGFCHWLCQCPSTMLPRISMRDGA